MGHEKELETVPILGLACKVLGHIYIDRSDTKSAVETISAAKTKSPTEHPLFFSRKEHEAATGISDRSKKAPSKWRLISESPFFPSP